MFPAKMFRKTRNRTMPSTAIKRDKTAVRGGQGRPLIFRNSLSINAQLPRRETAILNASASGNPDDSRVWISSRKWFSNSPNRSGSLTPVRKRSERHSFIRSSRSNILFQAAENRRNHAPLFTLLLECLLAALLYRVIFSFAAVLDFDPPRFNPAVILHPIQHGIEHAINPLDFVLGKPPPLLNERVTIA